MEIKSLGQLKQVLRDGPYAWPGGYPLFLITGDCCALSFDGARKNWREIITAFWYGRGNDPWRITHVKINYEDGELLCAATGKRIESAYAED